LTSKDSKLIIFNFDDNFETVFYFLYPLKIEIIVNRGIVWIFFILFPDWLWS